MKKFLPVIIGLLCIHTAYAHELVTDQGVGAVFHIDPNDTPVPGETATISAIFQPTNQFDLTKCGCDVLLSEGNKVLFDKFLTDPLFKVTPKNVTFQYIFPDSGAYTIAIAGEDFRLVYNFEVLPDANTANTHAFIKNHWQSIALFGAAIGCGMYVIIGAVRGRNKRKYI